MSESNLEDRAAIHDLFTRYCCALDNGEVEAVVDCFTVDAILKSPVIDVSGQDDIRSFANRCVAQRAAGTQFRHMVCNIAVTIPGNRATASAYLLVLISKDGNHRSLPPGRCACELIKEDGGQWRFSRRTVFHDHDYTLDGIGRLRACLKSPIRRQRPLFESGSRRSTPALGTTQFAPHLPFAILVGI